MESAERGVAHGRPLRALIGPLAKTLAYAVLLLVAMGRTLRSMMGLSVIAVGLWACSEEEGSTFDPRGEADSGAAVTNGPVFGDPGGGDGGATAVCAPAKGNYDVPGNNCDDDADGKVDNPPTCDGDLAVDGDGAAFARALGLCQTATAGDDSSWGVVSAQITNGFGQNGAPAASQTGILAKYGDVLKPREGARLGVLSTGYAREYNADTGTTAFKGGAVRQTGVTGTLPPGFPKAAVGCPQGNTVYDVTTVRLKIKAPKNAQGVSFDFNFFSGEWPEFVCTAYNDGFIAYLKSSAFNGGNADNISFDAQKNPVSVNNGFFDRCTPNTLTGCRNNDQTVRKTAACAGGVSELAGTGFAAPLDTYCGTTQSSPGGATGWLTSRAPVKPGEVIELEFIIWDTGDGRYDSTVLLDKLTWEPGAVTTETKRPDVK